MWSPDDYLMLSGIQHFLFCKRQWALIHIEQMWEDNFFTTEGQLVHQKVDQPMLKEKRRGLIFSRAMPISSPSLGLSGILDCVEFIESENGIALKGRKKKWLPRIVEYKRGKKKKYAYDEVQLMAQAICLEETWGLVLDYGYLYYHETDCREKVAYTKELRTLTVDTAQKMHEQYLSRKVPKAEFYRKCTLCSLYEECRPRLTKKSKNVDNYLFGADL